MKRFTETNKWREPWYRKLSCQAKQLWEYLRDNCDAVGFIIVDFTLVSADCGQTIKEQHITELTDRVQSLGEGRYYLRDFISFQYGELTESCPPHRSIIKLVDAHGLVRVSLGYDYPNARVALPYRTRQDKKEEGGAGEEGAGPKPVQVGPQTLPDALRTDEFKEAWQLWLNHLKQKRKPAGASTQDFQLRKLAKLGPARAIEAIHNSIEHNWQGIYEPNTTNGKISQKPNPRNFGVATGGTNYPEAAKRKMERDSLEAQRLIASQAKGTGS